MLHVVAELCLGGEGVFFLGFARWFCAFFSLPLTMWRQETRYKKAHRCI